MPILENPQGRQARRRNDLEEAEHRLIVEGRRRVSMSGRLPGRQYLLIARWGHHLAAGVPAVSVVVLNPRGHLGPGIGPGREVLQRVPPGTSTLPRRPARDCGSHPGSIIDKQPCGAVALWEEGWRVRGCQHPGMARPRRG